MLSVDERTATLWANEQIAQRSMRDSREGTRQGHRHRLTDTANATAGSPAGGADSPDAAERCGYTQWIGGTRATPRGVGD